MYDVDRRKQNVYKRVSRLSQHQRRRIDLRAVASAQVVSIGLLVLGILTMLVLSGVAHLFSVAAQRRAQPSHEHINAVLRLPARIRAGHGGDCAA
jgi:hypothetical protein